MKSVLKKIFMAVFGALFFSLVAAGGALAQWNKSNYSGTGLSNRPIADIIRNFAMWLLMVFGFIAVIGFVISGIMYLVAAGDEKAQERAKRAMFYSITGVIVGLIGLVVIYAVDYFLGGGTYYGGLTM